MAAKRKQRKQYYAVVRGWVNEPTIFSSWGDAHPRVTYYPDSLFKGFSTFDEACRYMEANGIREYGKVIKQLSLESLPKRGSRCYYAVANGATPGIYEGWYGADGAFDETNMWKGTCHRYFQTRVKAEAFLRDWESSSAEVCEIAAKRKQVGGLELKGIKLEDLGMLLRIGEVIKAEL